MQHSPSSISVARHDPASRVDLREDQRGVDYGGCDRAWWHRYQDKLKPPELSWRTVKHMQARGERLPVGAFSKALGKEVHRLAEFYLWMRPARAAKRIDWNDLPGQCLAELLPHLPPAGSVLRRNVERRISVVVNGVRFRGLIDVVGAAAGAVLESYDHKTSGDIRAYALLPHAVALRLNQPKRSLRDDLQACLYTLARAKETSPPALGGLCRWNYTETKRSRRALPVVQYVPRTHALAVAERAAVTAKRVESFRTIEDAVPNTLACDDYGGCWYRAEGHCKVRRHWGAVFIKLERDAEEQKNMGKLSFKDLGKATERANAKEEAKAERVSRKAKRPPVDEDEDNDTDEEENDEDEDEAPESERKPAKRVAKVTRKAKRDEPEDEDDEDDAPDPAPAPKAKRVAKAPEYNDAPAMQAPETGHVMTFFDAKRFPKGEARILAQGFAELADQVAQNPRNWERTSSLYKLLEARDCCVRSLAIGEEGSTARR